MKRPRILFADDSVRLLTALQCQLESHGFEVEICTDAYMALAQARKNKPDVMVLDIRMPAGNGFSVLERMGKIPELRHTPVIYVTGDKSAELELQASQLGAVGLIHKPLSLPRLLDLIDLALATGQTRAVPQKDPASETVWQIPDRA